MGFHTSMSHVAIIQQAEVQASPVELQMKTVLLFLTSWTNSHHCGFVKVGSIENSAEDFLIRCVLCYVTLEIFPVYMSIMWCQLLSLCVNCSPFVILRRKSHSTQMLTCFMCVTTSSVWEFGEVNIVNSWGNTQNCLSRVTKFNSLEYIFALVFWF